MTAIGFLGLGSMGSAIVSNLLSRGLEVAVWNRSEGPIRRMVELGATAATPAAALSCPVSISMLADDDAVDAVLTDEVLEAARGRVHACMSSISPGASERLGRRCADRGASYVAAPVLGRPEVAARGDLNIVAAGPTAALAELAPVLGLVGRRTWRVGEVPRTANVVKVAVNYNIIHALQALGESVALVEADGASARDFVDLLGGTLFGGAVHQVYGRLIAERDYWPAGFTLELGRKDLFLATSTAADLDLTLPSADVLRAAFEGALANHDLAGADWSAMAEVARTSRP